MEMPKDTTPKEALVAIQNRIQREKKTSEAQQGSPPPRHSSRLGSASTGSSPAQKEPSPHVKKKNAPPKKSQQQKLLDDDESEGEGKEVREAEVTEAEADNPPDYKDRVVTYTNSDNRRMASNPQNKGSRFLLADAEKRCGSRKCTRI